MSFKVYKCKDYEEASRIASDIFIEAIKENPSITLGLATGSTPLGLYKNLIKSYENKEISFKDVKTYNLDEYVGLNKDHKETYYNFMHRNLFDHIDIKEENIHIPFAKEESLEKDAKAYNDLLKDSHIDIQLLGIGENGHIGFNEPGTKFDQETFIVKLSENTRLANQRFFSSLEEVPHYAITMGIQNIMNAKKIVIVATGKTKEFATKKLLSNEISEEFPASVLHLHQDVIFICDKEALGE